MSTRPVAVLRTRPETVVADYAHLLRLASDVDPAVETRAPALLDADVLVSTNGLVCISTPMGERELQELAAATEHAIARTGEAR